MESKIIKQEKNPFLSREEFVMEIVNDTAPTFDEVKAELGKSADLTVVKKVHTGFGKSVFIVDAVVYDDAETKDKIEVIPQKVRKKMEADRKAAEEAAKAEEEAKKKAEEEAKAAAEAAAEENKEEAPAEEEKTE